MSACKEPERFYIEATVSNIKFWEKHYNVFETIGFKFIYLFHQVIRLIGYSFCCILNITENNKDKINYRSKVRRHFLCIIYLVFGYKKYLN